MIATQPSKPVVRPRGKPPRPWWDYEEELARQKQQARHELAELRQQHTQDLGILLGNWLCEGDCDSDYDYYIVCGF